MIPDEQVSDPPDKRKPGTALPRHHSARSSGNAPRRGRLWGAHEVLHEPEPLFGVYPVRFLDWVLPLLGTPDHRELLHVCSGTLSAEVLGIRVDLARRAAPDVIADGRRLPFAASSFRAVLIDPPYTVEYAASLYGTDYPRPSHLLAEASRVLRPGGRVGILHYLVPFPPPGCRFREVRAISQGLGYRIRALTIFERHQAGLFDEGEPPL